VRAGVHACMAAAARGTCWLLAPAVCCLHRSLLLLLWSAAAPAAVCWRLPAVSLSADVMFLWRCGAYTRALSLLEQA